tara:strand:+ start:3174 stop:3833 length:660 start_codon:yes stop_codon:yes gene_type:complete
MLVILTISVTPIEQNARVLIDRNLKNALVVDPGGDIDKITASIPDDVSVTHIFITHSHIDHAGGTNQLLKACAHQIKKPIIVAHKDDAINRDMLELQSHLLHVPYTGCFEPTLLVNHNDYIHFGNYIFKSLHTPGHAVGHLAYFCDSIDNSFESPFLLAGDTLFKGSIGRTDLPGGNHSTLINSINDHIFSLPPATVVCSGHGPNTTVSQEKERNPFFN